jgi:hypothetical protein
MNMTKKLLITVGVVLLLMFCACGNRNVKVEENAQVIDSTEYLIDNSTQDNDNAEYLIPDSAFCQTTAKSIDKVLSDSYRNLRNYSWHNKTWGEAHYAWCNIYSQVFDTLLEHYLSSPVTFHNTLDTLETLIEIRQSPNKKIKFYSWCDYSSMRNRGEFWSIAQFEGTENKILSMWLNDGSCTVKIYEIAEKQNTYYLTLGWYPHDWYDYVNFSLCLYKIDGDSLKQCKAFNGETSLSSYYSNWEELEDNTKFDGETKTLTYGDYDMWRFDEPHVTKKLKFSNGKFNEI